MVDIDVLPGRREIPDPKKRPQWCPFNAKKTAQRAVDSRGGAEEMIMDINEKWLLDHGFKRGNCKLGNGVEFEYFERDGLQCRLDRRYWEFRGWEIKGPKNAEQCVLLIDMLGI